VASTLAVTLETDLPEFGDPLQIAVARLIATTRSTSMADMLSDGITAQFPAKFAR
jgi:hypothetical protein